jgi:molybdopterin-guanine dinucleotide biosynthesis protein A
MPYDRAEITAAVLAGGEGRRVGGRDKGLLPLAGRPLIAHVVSILRDQAGGIIVCANRNETEYARFGTVVRDDAAPGFRGPLAGIAGALARCQTPWLLTVPVDGPEFPQHLALRLYDAAAIQGRDVAAVHDGQRAQPMFALYRRTLAAKAAEALRENLPVQRWQENLRVVYADFSDEPEAFENLNTPEDFLRWEEAHGG